MRGRNSAGLVVAFEPLQVGTNVRGVLVSKVVIFFQTLVDNLFELGRQIGIESNCRSWITIQDRFKNDSCTFTTERNCAGCHFIEHCSKGEQISATVEFLSPYLLRGHIGDRSE